MGLDILSASEKDYHFSYHGLHEIRYMAYRSIGGKLDEREWYKEQANETTETPEYDKALAKFPNLYWHSDCDGKYTRRGRVESFDKPGNLQTGNSVGLLKELQFVKDNLPVNDSFAGYHEWMIFNAFYDVVKDVVENYDGVIQFC